MSIYSTPLQVGYFLALVMALSFWYRGWREERLSDGLLGWVLFMLAMEMQDYTFGFSGINILWEELNGFPRGVSLLFGPVIYFYLRAQVNRSFHLSWQHLIHLLPWFLFFSVDLYFFVQGKYVVQWWQGSNAFRWTEELHGLFNYLSYAFYFTMSLNLYRRYRKWATHQYSDQEVISFKWFRNFIFLMIFGMLFKVIMFALDAIFDWDFYQDWWWNLGLVAITFYVGIQGYAQLQPVHISFANSGNAVPQPDREPDKSDDVSEWQDKITAYMMEHKPYLNAQLTLRDLAALLHTNPTTLSSAINQNFNKNFNDFINSYRVEEFLKRLNQTEYRHFTLLALALDCGFNSKATFNRAFRKITGKSPVEFRNGYGV
ncbi:MAG: helix-turn-helix transcriptional regulator [Saprospiraceae bacterium]|nr:helix-turn-helix transcriptional regulator [Saprospiraceae bacterium]